MNATPIDRNSFTFNSGKAPQQLTNTNSAVLPQIILESGKRKQLSAPNETEPQLKKAKIEPISSSSELPEPFVKLPAELICHLVSFFAFEDLLNFELSFKEAQNYTSDYWKRERVLRHLNFPFVLCTGLVGEKQRYIFVASIVSFIFEIFEETLTLERAHKIQEKYSYIMSRFPTIHQIILEDLSRKLCQNYCDFEDRVLNSFIFENSLNPKAAGEIFLLGFRLTIAGQNPYDYFKKAVQNGVTVAGLFYANPSVINNMPQVLELATLCADQGDHRALDKVLHYWPGMAAGLQQGKLYPSLLLNNMWEAFAEDEEKVFALSRQALSAYGRDAPASLYECVARTWMIKGRSDMAKPLLQKALAAYGKNPSAQILIKAAKVNYRSGNYLEAERFCEQFDQKKKDHWKASFNEASKITALVKMALKKYDEALNFLVICKSQNWQDEGLERIAFVQTKRKKYKKADRIYAKIKASTPWILFHRAYVKFKLGNFQESATIFQKALNDFDEDTKHFYRRKALLCRRADKFFVNQFAFVKGNPGLLLAAAYNKELLKQYSEADQLYDQARNLLGDRVEVDTLSKAMHLKLNLKKYAEADKILEDALKIHEIGKLNSLILSIVEAKMLAGDLAEADRLFDLIPTRNIKPLHRIAYKIKMKKWSDADAIFEKLKPNPLPLTFRMEWAYVKTKLEQWKEADEIYMKNLDGICSARDLYCAAYTKFRLNQFSEASTLFSKAVLNTSGETDRDLFENADQFFNFLKEQEALSVEALAAFGRLKYLLNKFEEADHIFEQLIGSSEVKSVTLLCASEVKMALKEFTKANELIDQALKIYGNEVQLRIWCNAAFYKRKCGKIRDANRLFDQVFEKFSDKIEFKRLLDMVHIKSILKMWNQAEQIADVILNSSKKIDFQDLLKIATVKTKLGRPEAEALMKKALRKLDMNNISHLNALAAAKTDLWQLNEADEIYEKCLQDATKKIPAHFFANWAYVKLHLGEIEKSVELYDQAIAKGAILNELSLEAMHEAKALLEASKEKLN